MVLLKIIDTPKKNTTKSDLTKEVMKINLSKNCVATHNEDRF